MGVDLVVCDRVSCCRCVCAEREICRKQASVA